MNVTIPQRILQQLDQNSGRVALRHKVGDTYKPVSAGQVAQQIRHYGRNLIALGLQPGERVAIMAPNSPEWVYADQGAMAAGAVSVPVYHTEGIEALLHIVRDSGSRVLFIRSQLMAQELTERLDDLPDLQQIILLGGSLNRPQVLSLNDFLAGGSATEDDELERRLAAGRGDELATLIYTSGTTGLPKGVMLKHDNILGAVTAATSVFSIGPDDTCLSFLPLSHVFERVDGYYLMMLQGATIAYAESIDTVPVNLVEIQPTVVISVPRLYEKMFARVMERVLSGPLIKKQLFFAGLKIGGRYSRTILAGEQPGALLRFGIAVARKLVFSKLHERLGGRLRFFISGGAALVRNVAEFFHAAGIPIYEGYGLTETSAGVAANTPEHMRLGCVGRPFPGTKIRIADDGEILLRGPGVFSGYWQRDELTAEVFVDGWFQTGDIGEVDADGFLAITDRKKDLIVTAGGENVAPQNLENTFKSDKYLSNAMIYGDAKPFLTALLVPNFENLEKYARFKKLSFLNHCDLVNHPQVIDLIRRRIDPLQKDLPAFNQVKRFTLLSRDFTSADGEITPTMKLKRKVVMKNFHQVLEGMYLAEDHDRHDSGFCIIEDNAANKGDTQ
jgi:long-chain acyl-CoA synthetase